MMAMQDIMPSATDNKMYAMISYQFLEKYFSSANLGIIFLDPYYTSDTCISLNICRHTVDISEFMGVKISKKNWNKTVSHLCDFMTPFIHPNQWVKHTLPFSFMEK